MMNLGERIVVFGVLLYAPVRRLAIHYKLQA